MINSLKILCFLLIFNSFSNYGQKKFQNNSDKTLKLFASIDNDNIRIKTDTISYKVLMAKKLFPEENITFDKIEIRKQKSIGSSQDIYIIYLQSGNNIRAARYLIKRGKGLYVNNFLDIDSDDFFEQICLVCRGIDECSPEVFTDKKLRMWGCSKTVGCNADDDENTSKCISQQSIVSD